MSLAANSAQSELIASTKSLTRSASLSYPVTLNTSYIAVVRIGRSGSYQYPLARLNVRRISNSSQTGIQLGPRWSSVGSTRNGLYYRPPSDGSRTVTFASNESGNRRAAYDSRRGVARRPECQTRVRG